MLVGVPAEHDEVVGDDGGGVEGHGRGDPRLVSTIPNTGNIQYSGKNLKIQSL